MSNEKEKKTEVKVEVTEEQRLADDAKRIQEQSKKDVEAAKKIEQSTGQEEDTKASAS